MNLPANLKTNLVVSSIVRYSINHRLTFCSLRPANVKCNMHPTADLTTFKSKLTKFILPIQDRHSVSGNIYTYENLILGWNGIHIITRLL